MFRYGLCLLPNVNDKTATIVCHFIYSYESVSYLYNKIEWSSGNLQIWNKKIYNTLFLFVKLGREVNAFLSLIILRRFSLRSHSLSLEFFWKIQCTFKTTLFPHVFT